MQSYNKYQLLDSGNFLKLEQIGPYRVVRPAAQAIWSPSLKPQEWKQVDAVFHRNKTGEGKWQFNNKKIPERWFIELGAQKMYVYLTSFGHIGLFPEHNTEAIWGPVVSKKVAAGEPVKILNLFAYTGYLSLKALALGAELVHVDASKTSIQWAKDNAELSSLSDKPVRWILDDAKKFVAREKRRGNTYHGIILDPPSYGRGPKGGVWKIEEHLPELLKDLKDICAKDFCFVQLSSHSSGHTPLALERLLREYWGEQNPIKSFEMIVPEKNHKRELPCGACALLLKER